MSDEEGGWQEEAENEQPEDTGARDEEKSRSKKHEEKGEEKTEAQLLMEAKQKKHDEEERERLRDLEEQRRQEREKEEEELRRLKEKQAQRKKEREEEERRMEEQRVANEEKRKQEEEQRKVEKEEEKRRKQEEAERKKAAATAAIAGGRNFFVQKESSGESTLDKFMNISKAKTEMGLNANELEQLKRRTIEERVKPLAVGDLDFKSLQKKAEDLWKTIVTLETAMYDLTERSKRQEYDLKELNERQRQTNQKKYVAQGLDTQPNSRHPPKVQIVSKYERRTDRRTFVDRKGLFDGSQNQKEEKEMNRPKGVKRDNWIKPKEVERKRGSRDEVEEEEDAPVYQSSRHDDDDDRHQQEEEVGAEDEE